MGSDSIIVMALTYNWDILGHDTSLQLLEDDLTRGQVSHAYLFAGPESVGKFAVAKRMAHILQCEGNFCGECHVCKEIEKGYHGDTIEMADDGDTVKIESVRKLMDRSNMSGQSPKKILLMQNIERMTLESSNALLKTLEDPTGDTVFLLTTSNVKDVIQTILSRVRMVKFGRLADEVVVDLMRKMHPLIEEDMVAAVAEMALGRPGKALDLLDDRELFERYRTMYEDVEQFLRAPDRTKQFLYIEELTKAAKEDGHSLLKEFLDVFQVVLRRELLVNAEGKRAILGRDKILQLLDKVMEAQYLLQRNINARLLLENMMLTI